MNDEDTVEGTRVEAGHNRTAETESAPDVPIAAPAGAPTAASAGATGGASTWAAGTASAAGHWASPQESPLAAPPPAQLAGGSWVRRTSGDRVIGGVCGGIGRRYGIDPAILRVIFVVSVLAGGVGLFGYAALWLLLPRDDDPRPGSLTSSVWRLVLGSLIGALAVLAVFGWLRSLAGLVGVVVGGLLVGVAVWMYNSRGGAPGRPGAFGGDSDQLGSGAVPPAGFAYGGTGAWQPPASPTPGWTSPQPPPKPRQPRSYLGLIALCAAVTVSGTLAVGAVAGLYSISVSTVMAVALLIMAAGIVTAAFRGRAKWLLVPALPLALLLPPVVLAENALPQVTDAFRAGVGERTWRPVAPGANYELGAGQAVLDLTTWAEGPRARQPRLGDSVSAKVRLGELVVIVPDTWRVALDASVATGDIGGSPGLALPDARRSGGGAELLTTLGAVGDPTGSVTVKASVDAGEIIIRRAAPAAVGPTPTPTPTPASPTPTPASPTPADRQPARSPAAEPRDGRQQDKKQQDQKQAQKQQEQQ